MWKRNIWSPLAFVVVTLLCVASAQGQATNADPAGNQKSHSDKQASDSHAFLGVAVEAVPPCSRLTCRNTCPMGACWWVR